MPYLPKSIQATLGEDEAAMLVRLVQESGLSRWQWGRGAIRAARGDPFVAAAIVAAAPAERRGGARPGAGRPAQGSKQSGIQGQDEEQL